MMIRPVCFLSALLLAAIAMAQEPSTDYSQKPKLQSGITSAALQGSKQDPAAVERGGKDFATYCAGCHGPAGKGGPGAPDLIRSVLVLDDEKGILIAPVIREGRPDKGMPRLGLNEQQISDLVAWLHVRTYAADHRSTYEFQNVLTGNPQQGKIYFQKNCAGCHSAQGDLAGIGKKYDPLSLQSRWLDPESDRNYKRTVTVLLPSGEKFSGKLEFINDFDVALRDEKGQYHSFTRNGDEPKVTIHDPAKAHTELLSNISDADIHNVTAYLATLK